LVVNKYIVSLRYRHFQAWKPTMSIGTTMEKIGWIGFRSCSGLQTPGFQPCMQFRLVSNPPRLRHFNHLSYFQFYIFHLYQLLVIWDIEYVSFLPQWFSPTMWRVSLSSWRFHIPGASLWYVVAFSEILLLSNVPSFLSFQIYTRNFIIRNFISKHILGRSYIYDILKFLQWFSSICFLKIFSDLAPCLLKYANQWASPLDWNFRFGIYSGCCGN
jgi:hypothetical protein